jgi:chaperonin GroES
LSFTIYKLLLQIPVALFLLAVTPMSFPLKPLHDYVLVQPEPIKDQIKASGLIIPGVVLEAESKILSGTVIAVGPGNVEQPTVLKAGDKVTFNEYAGVELEWLGERYLMMKEHAVYHRD